MPPLLRQTPLAVWHLAPLEEVPDARPRVLIGGVGYWWQRDGSFGLEAVDALLTLEWPPGVRVEKLDYGAIYLAQDLLAVDPPYDRMVLIAGTERGRAKGSLHLSRWSPTPMEPEKLQLLMYGAGSGLVDLDHLLPVAHHFGALPEEVVMIELEMVDSEGGEGLSPAAAERLEEVVELARREALAPLPAP
jgi:hydrogenase maturation protease